MDAVGSSNHRTEKFGIPNMSNGHGPSGGRTHKHAHDKVKSSSASQRRDFLSPSPHEHDRPEENASVDLQTTKVVKAFLDGIRSKTGKAEEIRKSASRKWHQEQSDLEDNRTSASGRVVNGGPVHPTKVRQKPANDDKLYKVMSGQMTPRRHQSDISLVSSDSADSGGHNGTFLRTKSFTKAQRQSIVTELEERSRRPSSRRSSEDIPQTLPLYSGRTTQSSLDSTIIERIPDSPVVHTRASSDPVVVKYDTTGKRKPQAKEKEKEKKSWLKSRFFKKKKDSSKLKDESKESDLVIETATTSALNSTNGMKVRKVHSDRRALVREDSSRSRKRTPSPPGSPKRTPTLIRRISSLKKKTSKAESFSSSSSSHRDTHKISSKSRSVDILEDDGGFEAENGDSKSNSLPTNVKLSTKPLHDHGLKKHRSKDKDNRINVSSVAVDSVSEHPGKSSKKSRELPRPSTLDLQKKKPSTLQKLKKKFFDSSSSSSSDSEEFDSSDCGELSKNMRDLVNRDAKENETLCQAKDSSGKPKKTLKHHHSDFQPTVTDVRSTFHHRATRSMNDIDPQDKNLEDIGKKLQVVADNFSLLFSQQYVCPAGRTHTPDSYQQEMKRSNGRATPVTRSASHAATSSGGRVSSHSMKAYYNLAEASRAKGAGEAGSRRPRTRITRNEILHRPTGSFDSPHRGGIQGQWSDRIQAEKMQKSEVQHDGRKESHAVRSQGASHHFTGSPRTSHAAGRPHPLASSSQSPSRHDRHQPLSSHSRSRDSPRGSHSRSRDSPRGPPPPPTLSASPNLRSSRSGRVPYSSVASDSVPSNHHVHRELHIDSTITGYAPDHTRTVHIHRDIIDDAVETDALPSSMADNDSTDIDMAMVAFADDNEIVDVEVDTTTETITVTEDVDGVPLSSAPQRRPRAATTPSSMPSFDSELDGDDDEELGAVGGAEPGEETEDGMDEEKLVLQLVQALCKKGDEFQLDPGVETELNNMLLGLTKEKAKEVMRQALARFHETASRCLSRTPEHPEIYEMFFLLRMAGMFGDLISKPSCLGGVWKSFFQPVLNKLGGWDSANLISSLEETLSEQEQEQANLSRDVPSTSGLSRQDRRRNDNSRDRRNKSQDRTNSGTDDESN